MLRNEMLSDKLILKGIERDNSVHKIDYVNQITNDAFWSIESRTKKYIRLIMAKTLCNGLI